jgi:hypothetical protein
MWGCSATDIELFADALKGVYRLALGGTGRGNRH